MFSIKSFAMAAAVSASVVVAMPVTSQAMHPKATVHVQTGSQSNLETKKSKYWWMRHCRISNDVKCGHHYTLRHHHNRYYGHYKYRHHKPGVGVTIKTY